MNWTVRLPCAKHVNFFCNLSLCPPLHTYTSWQCCTSFAHNQTNRRKTSQRALVHERTEGCWTLEHHKQWWMMALWAGPEHSFSSKILASRILTQKKSVTSPSENCQPLQTNNAAFLPYLSLIALQGTEAAPKIELIPGPFFQTGRAAIVRALDQTSWMTAYENENSFWRPAA